MEGTVGRGRNACGLCCVCTWKNLAERGGFEPPVGVLAPTYGLAKTGDCVWLAGKLMKTEDAVRLALGGLGMFGSLLG
jgi:hypothetical protein